VQLCDEIEKKYRDSLILKFNANNLQTEELIKFETEPVEKYSFNIKAFNNAFT